MNPRRRRIQRQNRKDKKAFSGAVVLDAQQAKRVIGRIPPGKRILWRWHWRNATINQHFGLPLGLNPDEV